MVDSFAPWILPFDNNGQILLPWIINDVGLAAEMVSDWLDTVEFLHSSFEGWSYCFIVRLKFCLIVTECGNFQFLLILADVGFVNNYFIHFERKMLD